MPLDPGPDPGVLVGGVVVQEKVEVELRIGLLVDAANEAEELLVPLSREALVDDFPRGGIQNGEEGRGAVPLVVEGQPLLSGRPGWVRSSAWIWLSSSKEKTIARSGGRCTGRQGRGVSHELRVFRELELLDQTRLDDMDLPDPSDLAVMHPVAVAMRRWLECVPSAGVACSVLRITLASTPSVTRAGSAGRRPRKEINVVPCSRAGISCCSGPAGVR
jgi:hypothetical protein